MPSCKNTARKTVKETSETIAEKVIEKEAKQTAKGAAVKGAQVGLKELVQSNMTYKFLYERLEKFVSKDFADGILVKSTKEATELISKDFPNSAIKIQGNVISGKGGSLVNSGPVNEFLNHLLKNKTYIVDNNFVYKTDHLGRVVSAKADRTTAATTIKRNTQRNSDVQRMIVESLDGKVGVHDGGHLFANNTGGPNELINQVPMLKKLNRTGGRYRELEMIEEKAIKANKKVVSERKLIYEGTSKCPTKIQFVTHIDGVKVIDEILDNVIY